MFFQDVKGCRFLFTCAFNHFLSTLLVTCPCDWRNNVKWGLYANSVLHKIIIFFSIIFTFVWHICQFTIDPEWSPATFSLPAAYSLPLLICWYMPQKVISVYFSSPIQCYLNLLNSHVLGKISKRAFYMINFLSSWEWVNICKFRI